MGSTSKRGLRYPESTVLANTLHTQIKNLADDTDLGIDYTVMSGGFQKFDNLAQFQDPNNALPGYIVIQTNMSFDNIMTRLHIRGWTYELNNNVIDLIFTMYPFTTTPGVYNIDVANRGSFNFSSISAYTRNSDNKIAIVLESNSSTPSTPKQWDFPKITVDGMFAHSTIPVAQLTSGWSITRQTSLAAYTYRNGTPKGLWGACDDTGWIALPTLGNWSSYASSFPARYKREAGWVTVEGLVKKSTAAGTAEDVAQLPTNFRPEFPVIGGGATPVSPFTSYVYANANGIIQIGNGANATWTSLAGMRFRAVPNT